MPWSNDQYGDKLKLNGVEPKMLDQHPAQSPVNPPKAKTLNSDTAAAARVLHNSL